MANTPADRLRALRIKKGFASALEAARAFGWNPNTYSSHEGGARGLRRTAAERYARAYGASPGYILFGATGAKAVVNDVSTAPLVGIVSAGVFREAEQFEETGGLVPIVPRRDIPEGAQYALRIDGNSVNKRIPHGMYAICAPYESYPGGAPEGSLVHVVRERAGLFEHTIKELHFVDGQAVLMPVSDDPRHQKPVRMDGEEEVTIKGVVIGRFEPF